MSDLYYIAPEDSARLDDGVAVLSDAEARHLTKVLRKKVGDEVDLFDGRGVEYHCRIASIAKDKTELTVLATRRDDREPNVAATAIVALPKGDRQKWAIEKLTELGVRRFIPLDAERADVKFSDGVLERLERQVLEASKQCGRLRLMDVRPAAAFSELPALVELLNARLTPDGAELSNAALELRDRLGGEIFEEFAPGDDVLRVIAHPISDGFFGQRSFMELVAARQNKTPRGVLLLIGPVGGFADSEVQAAVNAGWEPLDLGRQVYRVETAAIVAAALFLHLPDPASKNDCATGAN